jgi:hypothetical protein
MHSLKSIGVVDVNKLMEKSLSFLCYFWMDGNFLTCENVPWNEEWELKMLVTTNATFVCNMMVVDFNEDYWDLFDMNGNFLPYIGGQFCHKC